MESLRIIKFDLNARKFKEKKGKTTSNLKGKKE